VSAGALPPSACGVERRRLLSTILASVPSPGRVSIDRQAGASERPDARNTHSARLVSQPALGPSASLTDLRIGTLLTIALSISAAGSGVIASATNRRPETSGGEP
jgi:hypothetical protein